MASASPPVVTEKEKQQQRILERESRPTVRAPSAHAEIFLESSPEMTPTTWAGIESPSLDRATVEDALAEIDHLSPVHADEWADDEGRLLVSIGEGRLILRLTLFDETKEQLARRLDALFDLGFELAHRLRLDLVDPLLDTALTRHRYETQFPRILDAYHRKARTSAVLVDPREWRTIDDSRGLMVTGDPLAAIETEPDSVPHAVWGRRGRRLDPLELTGERALAALAGLSAERPFLALLPPGSKPGDTGAILRVRRVSNPLPGTALVEAVSEGTYRLRLVTRGPSGVLVRVDV